MIGNKVTPAKRYFVGHLQIRAADAKVSLREMLGTNTFPSLPLDAEGNRLYL
jgi:hypothetical protein